jgi:Sec-independent protein secretion pathway component TatC
MMLAIIVAAVPPTVDRVNMALVMAPMIPLYFLNIGLSRIAVLRQRRKPIEPA